VQARAQLALLRLGAQAGDGGEQAVDLVALPDAEELLDVLRPPPREVRRRQGREPDAGEGVLLLASSPALTGRIGSPV